MNQEQKMGTKEREIAVRRTEVGRLHIWGYSVSEIAERLGVDSRTISRDIQANRKAWLTTLTNGDANDVKKWLRDELADFIAFMNAAKKTFCEQSQSFTNESAKSRALWNAVQIENQKVETIKSLMFSFDDIHTGGFRLNDKHDYYED